MQVALATVKDIAILLSSKMAAVIGLPYALEEGPVKRATRGILFTGNITQIRPGGHFSCPTRHVLFVVFSLSSLNTLACHPSSYSDDAPGR